MPIQFQLEQIPAGFSLNDCGPGEDVHVLLRELLAPTDALHVIERLEQLQGFLFSKLPGLPPPSVIDHLLVVIKPNLSGTAYVNELNITANIKAARDVTTGEPVFVSDIADIRSVNLGVDIPDDAGIVLLRSFGWKRSLFFDFGPLNKGVGPRAYPLSSALAQQALLLLGLPTSADHVNVTTRSPTTRLAHMEEGMARLTELLRTRCEDEAAYQELLQEHPWMFGELYIEIQRHSAFDDRNIPDFTAVRCYDRFHDIIEIKQPFLNLVRKSGDFAAPFNDAWNQAERYLSFASQQRSYLREEKDLRFEYPRCFLLIGYQLSEQTLRNIRAKESFSRSVSVINYDHLVEKAQSLLTLMRAAGEPITPGIGRLA
ncbi:Shedu anti-phage system protein SduA domain-containing protein [Sorangium sp. So ce542]|uniref:Shedu anti-phage system protein SduA domain-containing protein n=1 Tax=Sorangium sp. So ce542 TaxID=3133316 RepID=UPI003F63D02B